MCKSNQYQSVPSLFNLTISRKERNDEFFVSSNIKQNSFRFVRLASLKILPDKENLIVDKFLPSVNLSCHVREVSMQAVDPTLLKWYKNNEELDSTFIIEQSSHWNQAKSMIQLPRWLINESDQLQCVYDNGKAQKNLRLYFNADFSE